MNDLWSSFSVKIRRRDTPFYAHLYRICSYIKNLSSPTIKPLHNFLYNEWAARTCFWHNFWRVIYYEPMFKSRCKAVGPGFHMYYAGNGITRIAGDIQLYLGSNVTIFDNTLLIGLKVYDKPSLYIDDNSYIGPLVRILVGQEVRIGKHCLITSRIITDNPGHPIADILNRLQPGGGIPAKEDIKPVRIGDYCFLPLDSVIYPGVTIGDGVVARIGTHINRDVPPFCQIGGNPFKIIKMLPIPPQIQTLVGPERYRAYIEAHESLKL